jgi:hypothetical protein
MGVASLANIPDTTEALASWSFNHMAHHRDINRVIFQLHNIALPEYPLDPFNPYDESVFPDQHQAMHNAQNAILQIDGNDLTGVNWSDPGQRAAWIWLNFTEHKQASDILGV